MKRAIFVSLVLAFMMGGFALPTTSAQKGDPYDYVMQDDSGCPVLAFNSKTGAYKYFDDEHLLAGVGKVSLSAVYTMRLTFKNSGYYGVFSCNLKVKTGSGYILQVDEGEIEETLDDSDMTNNTGECAP